MFYLDSDTALNVATEMAEQLDLTEDDAAFIADFIDFTIMRILPGWKPSSDCYFSGEKSRSGLTMMAEQCETPSADSAAGLVVKPESFHLDHRILLPTTYSNNLCENSNFASPHVTFILSPSSTNTGKNISSGSRTSTMVGEDVKDSTDDGCVENLSLTNQLVDNTALVFFGRDTDKSDLKVELDAIEIQYQQWFEELSKMKQEAIEATKKRWLEIK